MKEFSRTVSAQRQASQEIGKNDETEGDVERLHDGPSRQERRHDDEHDRDEVEYQETVAELVRADAPSFVESAQRLQAVRCPAGNALADPAALGEDGIDRGRTGLHGRRRIVKVG